MIYNTAVQPLKPEIKENDTYYPQDTEPVQTKLAELDIHSLRKEIKKRLHAAIRPLNSPVLSFNWENDLDMTETSQCPPVPPVFTKEEKARRQMLECVRYVLVVYFNGDKVVSTIPKGIDPFSFQLSFKGNNDLELVGASQPSTSSQSSAFVIRVTEPPRSIRVELIEEVLQC